MSNYQFNRQFGVIQSKNRNTLLRYTHKHTKIYIYIQTRLIEFCFYRLCKSAMIKLLDVKIQYVWLRSPFLQRESISTSRKSFFQNVLSHSITIFLLEVNFETNLEGIIDYLLRTATFYLPQALSDNSFIAQSFVSFWKMKNKRQSLSNNTFKYQKNYNCTPSTVSILC